jgi:hypothetical protein
MGHGAPVGQNAHIGRLHGSEKCVDTVHTNDSERSVVRGKTVKLR